MMTEELLPTLPPKTTDRQRSVFEIWATKYSFSLEGGALAKAYVEAGFSPLFARRNAYKTLYSSNLNKAVRFIMMKKNITLERLVDKFGQLLDCKHPFAPEKADNAIQLKAFQDGMKIMGGYPIPIQKVDVRHSEEYHISVEDQRKAEKTLQECIDVEPIEDGNDGREEPSEAERPLL